jgi:hypothetical protein
MFHCRNFDYTPPFARATSNQTCVTTKKNNLKMSKKTIQIGYKLYILPCFLLDHVDELTFLLKTMKFKDAVIKLAEKYDVSIAPPVQNIKRYIYPTNIGKSVPIPIQFKITFKLMELVTPVGLPPIKGSQSYTDHARRVIVCNDDTKTFTSSYSEMVKNSSFWSDIIPSFTKPYYFALIISNNLLTAQSGLLILQGDDVIFVPVMEDRFVFIYKPYSEGTSIRFMYIGDDTKILIHTLTNLYLSTPQSCRYGLIDT